MACTTTSERRSEPVALNAIDSVGSLLTDVDFNLDRLLEEVVRTTAESLGARGCTIRLLDSAEGDEMVLKASHGLSERYLSKGPVFAYRSFLKELLDKCRVTGEAIRIADVANDPRVQYPQEALAEGIRSVYSSPLLQRGEMIGSMTIYLDGSQGFREEDVVAFQALASHAAVSIHLAKLHQQRLEFQRVTQELNIAARIQANLMPERNPDLPGFEIAGMNHPCEHVGGDFYDFIALGEGNLGIAVGDVSGMGVPAALLMASTRTALRVQAENVYAMREVIGRVNRALVRDTRQESFATLFYGVLDGKERRLTYVNAGHDFPVLLRDGQVQRLKPGGVPVGMFEDSTYRERTLELRPDDLLLIYTDGFTEARNGDGAFFEEERLVKVVKENRDRSSADVVRALVEAVRQWEGEGEGYCDDKTAVVVRGLG